MTNQKEKFVKVPMKNGKKYWGVFTSPQARYPKAIVFTEDAAKVVINQCKYRGFNGQPEQYILKKLWVRKDNGTTYEIIERSFKYIHKDLSPNLKEDEES